MSGGYNHNRYMAPVAYIRRISNTRWEVYKKNNELIGAGNTEAAAKKLAFHHGFKGKWTVGNGNFKGELRLYKPKAKRSLNDNP